MAELLNQIIPDVVARSDQLWRAFWETIQMVGISGAISLVLGIPYGVLLFTTREGGVLQNRPVNFILGRVCDFFRSIPFILLAILLLGLSRLVVGVAIGVRGAIIPLVFGTVPFLGRQTESALAEVPAGLIEAAEAIGSSPWEIIWRVYLREAVPWHHPGGDHHHRLPHQLYRRSRDPGGGRSGQLRHHVRPQQEPAPDHLDGHPDHRRPSERRPVCGRLYRQESDPLKRLFSRL